MIAFVPASQLYDVASRREIQHPALDATDTDVHRAIQEGGLS